MKSSTTERRFSAILMADVVGYSRLMAQDVDSTIETLKGCRKIFADSAAGHGGWVVNTPGDSILAEFKNPVEAVKSACEIQREIEARNLDLPGDRKMQFRIGISHGQVVADENAIYGDEVNIAARLEGLAEPGGICISSIAHKNICDEMELACEYLGEHELKNIAKPVPIYRLLMGMGARPTRKTNPTSSRLTKPSIAVLPFANFSAEQEQDYFADGITEDIITELSRFKSLLVIARNSTFIYKGRAVTVQQVGRDLGVQYVLEGSVRKIGNRVRITAQLVEADDGGHLWAERYDRDLEDVFSIQDEIASMIVANIPRRLEAANLDRAKRKPTEVMAAYDFLLRGKDHHHRATEEDNTQAMRMLDLAIEHDPDLAQAYAWKACTLGQAIQRGYSEDRTAMVQEALTCAEKSRELDDEDSESHRILAEIHIINRRFDDAERHQERAFSLNPNDPRVVALKGQLLTWTGKPEEGASWIELARRLDPYPPEARADSLALAYFCARHYEAALKTLSLIGQPTHVHHANLAACHALLDHPPEARTHLEEVLRMQPEFSAGAFTDGLPYKLDADRAHHRDALLKAGLP